MLKSFFNERLSSIETDVPDSAPTPSSIKQVSLHENSVNRKTNVENRIFF